jgi:hypothetical protein
MPSLRASDCSWQVALLGQVGQRRSWLASSSSTEIRLGGHRAGALDAAAFDVHQAQPAGAVDAQLRVVAEGGQVDAGLADDLEQVALAVERHPPAVDGDEVLVAHFSVSPWLRR